MLTVINNKHVVCWGQVQDRKPIVQWKTICTNFRLLIKYFSISQPFYHHNSTRQDQLQQGCDDDEILLCPTEKKHGYEQLRMKRMTQIKDLTDTRSILSPNNYLEVITLRSSSSSFSSHNDTPSTSK